jgi:hypothetical protein
VILLSQPSQAFHCGVKRPALMVHALKDSWMRNSEHAQKTFDLLANKEKELLWIEGTARRFKDGDTDFGRHPETIIAFLDKHMK